MEYNRGARVAVALSGGVDSAAAACILKESGFDLLALTMHTPAFDNGNTDKLAAARAVADDIGVEHQAVDVEEHFERLVIQPFLRTYINGETPNPCILCNRDVKFGLLMKDAKSRGCGLMATGHYARIEGGGSGKYRVLRARDLNKDQSYVLWTLDQTTLGKVLFPLGNLTKRQASALARDAGMRNTAPDSQDVCFLKGGSYADLVAARAPESFRPGPVVSTEGVAVGTHRGLPFYTVGQRRGLGIGGPAAMYVLDIDPGRNTLVVGERRSLSADGFLASSFNFISGEAPADRFECLVKTRYRGSLVPAEVEMREKDLLAVRYQEPGPPAAPGQSVVFYSGDELLGGGVIVRERPSGRQWSPS